MVRFSLKIKTCCLYVISEKQDQMWARFFASAKICTPVGTYDTVNSFVVNFCLGALVVVQVTFAESTSL